MGAGTKAQGEMEPRQVQSSAAAATPNNASNTGTINRKKQKRRQKQAARLAAEDQNGNEAAEHDLLEGQDDYEEASVMSRAPVGAAAEFGYIDPDLDERDTFGPGDHEDDFYSDEGGQLYHAPYDPGNASANGHPVPSFLQAGKSSKRSKKKKKGRAVSQAAPTNYPGDSSTSLSTPSASYAPMPPPPPPPPPLSAPTIRQTHSISRDRIWNTSTQEERERIKEFWLSLGEEDRRSLVKVEKEAVLRKMKEQQKHSCSCTVCGRKRTAIEEELEVLYDAYYEELEQYANHQQVQFEDGTASMPPPGKFRHMGRFQTPDRIPPLMHARSSQSRIQELPDDQEEDLEDDDESRSAGSYDDEDPYDGTLPEQPPLPDEPPQGNAADFFNFGNSLTVQDGILTVADDLLKNDGKKFIEMMEQLAERRMQREEEAQYAAAGLGHPSMSMGQHLHAGHNHAPPLPEDEDYDDDDEEEEEEEEEEDDYDESQEDDYDEDDMEHLTEEQRMEEGRRMFQIFAARMFEQRVLTAYREKVAQERQQKLLEELEEESRLDTQREQKKAKEAQKKKDKKRLQKQVKEEEKARKDAEKAAEEAAARAVEEKKAEEQRLKREEQRKRREAEKRAQEEERLKKDAEKQRRLQEERERQAEQERKQRELKEREKKKREELRKKEREEREAKEKTAREKKEQDDRERREKEAKTDAAREGKERARKEEQAAAQAAALAAQASRRLSQGPPMPTPPGLNSPLHAGMQSPHLPVATPVIPKAPTPIIRPRQVSQHGSVASSPKTPQVGPGQGQSISPSNATSNPQSPGPVGLLMRHQNGQQPAQQAPSQSSLSNPMIGPPGASHVSNPGFPGMAPMNAGNVSYNNQPPMMSRGPVGHEGPGYSHQQAPIGSRGFIPHGSMPFPHPGSSMSSMSQGREMQPEAPPGTSHPTSQPPMKIPSGAQAYGRPRDTMPSHSGHSRHHSASFEAQNFENMGQLPPTQPISRPAPIQRPSSVAVRQTGDSKSDVDDLSRHLGSSALLDDTDEPYPARTPGDAHGDVSQSAAGGSGRSRFGFGSNSMFSNPMTQNKDSRNLGGQANADNWGPSQSPFGHPAMPGPPSWSHNSNAGWSNNNAFGVIGGHGRPTASRALTIRLLTCQACKQLSAQSPPSNNGFHEISLVHRQVDKLRSQNEPPIQFKEVLDICDTEGDSHNGGGFFTVRDEGRGKTVVKFDLGTGSSTTPGRGPVAPGEIGSPIAGSSMPAFGGPRPFHPSSSSNAVSSPGVFH
ncbi:MAG: hypothetical protein M4579_000605 [Chaenotheca gracillima]|nr:MAG: hypothetical protein M4579_000605 [Chaenotheca gracillima]